MKEGWRKERKSRSAKEVENPRESGNRILAETKSKVCEKDMQANSCLNFCWIITLELLLRVISMTKGKMKTVFDEI